MVYSIYRILLEKDTPYFHLVPEHYVSAHHILHITAARVAAIIQNITTEVVLGVAHVNATEVLAQA